jgi:ABC-type multidrug transport system fused ATPase/permease subunit
VLAGLLEPSTGTVLTDDAPIGRARAAWFRRIAYVPQSIFILEDTVRANVLFGSSRQEDDEAIWTALELAQLAEKIRSLPNGLDSAVGESGALLSGGERQRLGIARALYRKPEFLILDEATSALDGATERLLMEGIAAHFPGITILTIAHRVSMARRSDTIILMDRGRIDDLGAFDELVSRKPTFRHLIAL